MKTGITSNLSLSLVIAALSATINFSAAAQNATSNPSKLDVAAIAPYVYPQNAANKPADIAFMPDGESYLVLTDNGRKITKFETTSGKEIETVLDTSHTRENSVTAIENFSLSPDGTKILLYTTTEKVYRRSFKADYYVFEIKRNILRPLSKSFPMQQAPVFSPDGRMVAFVVDNNIYIKKLDYDSEVAATTDGAKNSIINGVPDWSYEEEFDLSCAMAFSTDNSTLAYLKFNETQVPTFSFTLYEGWCNPMKQFSEYPGEFSYKYPLAGKTNSKVTLHSYDIETRKTKEITFNDTKLEYIPRIAFSPTADATLLVPTLNRAQNRMELYSVNPKSTVVKSLLVEESKAWLNTATYQDICLTADGFYIQSQRSGWNRIYKYSYSGQLLREIGATNCDVTAVYGQDALGNLYYQSVPAEIDAPFNALNRAIYRIDKLGKKNELLGQAEGWSSANFSPTLNYYVLYYSNATTPPVYSLQSTKGKKLRTLEDNTSYSATFASAPKKEFIQIASAGYNLNGYIIKPAGFTPNNKYPVIMWLYNGPGSQEVTNMWRPDWQICAAQNGFIVVCVDGRGTGYRGQAFQDCVYLKLGQLETIDQINVANHLATLPYVDPDNIGIAGWSYGGYETLMAITAPTSPFKAAVAIAPVTSWRFYDSVYTERFMLTPQENAEGYDDGAPINRARNLNCKLLIMSGTADDNVHLSNTMSFISALEADNRYCDLWLFPNMNHSIYYCNARAQVYSRMLRYFSDNLR